MRSFQTTAIMDEQGYVHIQVPDGKPGEAMELIVFMQSVPTSQPRAQGPPYTRPVDVGECLVDNVDNIAEVLAQVEGEDYK